MYFGNYVFENERFSGGAGKPLEHLAQEVLTGIREEYFKGREDVKFSMVCGQLLSGGSNLKKNKIPEIIVDILMYALLLIQMMYVFIGNVAHEMLGVGFFVCLIIHCVQKRWWYRSLFEKNKTAKGGYRTVFNVITILLVLSIVALMLSAMGVSRTLFPWFTMLGYVSLHRYLATAVLSLSAAHGMMHYVMRSKKKRLAVVLSAAAVGACIVVGLALVPYINRHAKRVEIKLDETVSGEKVPWNGDRALIVYFTRVVNTDFDKDVDAVSGASLMIADGELVGSNELIAMMLSDITGLEIKAIMVSGKKYPSRYDETVSIAGDEKREAARPSIEPLDISDYQEIILVYPLWWGDIPMPVATFLEENDFTGKRLYLIATQGSSGFSASADTIRSLVIGADVEEVMSIYCEDIPNSRARLLEWVRGH